MRSLFFLVYLTLNLSVAQGAAASVVVAPPSLAPQTSLGLMNLSEAIIPEKKISYIALRVASLEKAKAIIKEEKAELQKITVLKATINLAILLGVAYGIMASDKMTK